MRPTTVRPTGVERRYGDHEIIVSKTDAKGVITYANDVFLRVAQLDEADALGAPHNVIRHPDMPRAVFQLLWDTIAAGREIFAYVLNMAMSGDHYWVFAHVTPTFDRSGRITGYHSNRRAPDRSAVEGVTGVYAAMLAEEARHSRPKDAIAASTALLGQALTDRRQTYDQFVWSLVVADQVSA